MDTGTARLQWLRGGAALPRLPKLSPRPPAALRAHKVRFALLAATVVVLVRSVAGAMPAEAAGSPRCVVDTSGGTVAYLVGEACPPEGFVETMGYEPVLIQTAYGWRYAKPAEADGRCSGPISDRGPFWDFTAACQTHDYGYDLVRFGVGRRADADRVLFRDMMADCHRRGVVETGACKALAEWARAVLEIGDVTGFEPESVGRTW